MSSQTLSLHSHPPCQSLPPSPQSDTLGDTAGKALPAKIATIFAPPKEPIEPPREIGPCRGAVPAHPPWARHRCQRHHCHHPKAPRARARARLSGALVPRGAGTGDKSASHPFIRDHVRVNAPSPSCGVTQTGPMSACLAQLIRGAESSRLQLWAGALAEGI